MAGGATPSRVASISQIALSGGAHGVERVQRAGSSASTTSDARRCEFVRMCASCAPREAVLIGTGDRADPAAAEKDLDSSGAVAADHRDTVAALDAGAGEPPAARAAMSSVSAKLQRRSPA